MGIALIAVAAVLLVVVLFIIGIYNRLVTLRVRCSEAWAQIDVQLKKRTDMIPNLVETVKGYAAHEKSVLENVAKARAMMQEAGADPAKEMAASNMMTSTLKSLFAVAENYPELKANENFKMLQTEIAGIEDKIGYARQFYNECVMNYNEYQQVFPPSMFASMFGHSKAAFFEAEEADRKAPQVKF
ncbi:MAG: LemA family protein [Spirochaetia bacterium]|nr:LemA family protein [Spirochaetia bacterium]